MPDIRLQALAKRFGTATAVRETTLTIPGGVFLALLGASGCGKTTLLRLIAGFEAPSAGSITFGDRIVADARTLVPPEERAVGMVFQSYALWPHMSVAANVVYPLRVARRPKAEIEARLAVALDRVGLAGLGARMPETLSGGQRQRVALARALIQETGIVLFDEPLANLDAHLRAAMIDRFAQLHAETGRTFVYVTHDQAEALALATRLAVMVEGAIIQFAAPETVYREPATRAVAAFIGRGSIVPAEVAGAYRDGRVPVRIDGVEILARAGGPPRGPSVEVLVRPEGIAAGGPLPLSVARVRYRGGAVEVTATTGSGLELRLDLAEKIAVGDHFAAAMTDAWVLPDEAGGAPVSATG